jgi:polyhydroxybutyrate depolymerase
VARLGVLAVFSALLAISGCSSPTPDGGVTPDAWATTTRTVTVGGLERSFVVSAPASALTADRLPLLIMLHGAGGDAASFASLTGMTPLAEQSNFVVVYPNGTPGARVPGELAWNAGECCGTPARTGLDDVAFIDELITNVEVHFHTDPERVFVAGYSNGGMLSYRLVCELGERVAGIADVSGAFNVPECAAPAPTAVLIIHGTADSVVPYDGGATSAEVAERFGAWTNASVAAAVDSWATTNECDLEPVATTRGAVTTSRFTSCAADSSLELVSIAGGAHRWPTQGNSAVAASELIVQFFGLARLR